MILLAIGGLIAWAVISQYAARSKAWDVGLGFYHALQVAESKDNVDRAARGDGLSILAGGEYHTTYLRSLHKWIRGYGPTAHPKYFLYRTSGWMSGPCGKQVQVRVDYDKAYDVAKIAEPVEGVTGCM